METNDLINRINELAEKAYSENRFLFTDFLDMSQLSSFYSIEKDLAYVGTAVSGGTEGCERCIVRFGSP
jgi:RNA-binding protein YlmH